MKLNKYTKTIIILGSILTVIAMVFCALTDICAGKTGNYYVMMSYSRDFAILARQYTGLTILGGIITHVIYKEPDKE